MMNFNFNNPTNLYFGAGALNKLGSLEMPGKKAMVLISNGRSTKENGYLDRTLEQLTKQRCKRLCLTKSWRTQFVR